MRLLVTADLHYNHAHSKALAEEIMDQMNAAGGDVLLVVGDTAVGDGNALEQCLSRFRFSGPKLFVAGNHELWTFGPDSYELLNVSLPQRVAHLGWRWLQTEPFVAGDIAILGNVGWYDYSFAVPRLQIPRRFYEHGISPGAAARLSEFSQLLESQADVPSQAMQIVARWNDAKFVRLHRSDEAFLDELIQTMREQLESLRQVRQVIAAVHHVPFAELLPPHRGAQWDFARAFLGSHRIGELIREFDNVRHVLCGHSHFGVEAQIDQIQAVNIGSGYRSKRFIRLDV
jgi:Icc-related predicted phosphoesterase